MFSTTFYCITIRLRVALFPSEYASDSWVIGRVPYWILYLRLWSPRRRVPSYWSHIYVATRPLYPLVRRQAPNEGIKKLSTYLPTGLRFSTSGVIFSWAIAPKFCKTNRLFPLIEVDWSILSRPSTIVFVDDDNHGASGNLSESPVDSEFPTYSALVCWRFLGDSAVHKKPSP